MVDQQQDHAPEECKWYVEASCKHPQNAERPDKCILQSNCKLWEVRRATECKNYRNGYCDIPTAQDYKLGDRFNDERRKCTEPARCEDWDPV